MFSPVKAINAGALIFALGGVLLIAQPFDQQGGSVPGAATDEERAAPVEVTATSSAGACPVGATTEVVGGVRQSRGGYCNPSYTWSDPRLDGTVTYSTSDDGWLGESGVHIGSWAISIENDEGAWRMRPVPYIDFPGLSDPSGETWILDGEGAYEGLIAVLREVEAYTPHGFIIEGEFPPPPDNASTK
jgi:hypothetical protein